MTFTTRVKQDCAGVRVLDVRKGSPEVVELASQ